MNIFDLDRDQMTITMGWNQLVRVTLRRPYFRIFNLRVMGYILSSNVEDMPTNYLDSPEGRKKNIPWKTGPFECNWTLSLLGTEDYNQFEDKFEIYGKDPIGLKEDIEDYLSLLDKEVEGGNGCFPIKNSPTFTMESSIHPKAIGCVAEEFEIEDYGADKKITINGKCSIGEPSWRLDS